MPVVLSIASDVGNRVKAERQRKQKRMLDGLSRGMTWRETGRYVGVDRRTLNRWCAADPELAERAAEALAAADDAVEEVVFALCLDPDPRHNGLRAWWLRCRRPEVYGNTSRRAIEGKGSKPWLSVDGSVECDALTFAISRSTIAGARVCGL